MFFLRVSEFTILSRSRFDPWSQKQPLTYTEILCFHNQSFKDRPTASGTEDLYTLLSQEILPIFGHAKVLWSLSSLPCTESTASLQIQRWQPTHQAQLHEAFAQVSTQGWLHTTLRQVKVWDTNSRVYFCNTFK